MKKIKQVFPSRNYITIDSFGDVEVIFNPVGDGFEGDDKLMFRKGRWAFRVNDFLSGRVMPDGSKEGMGRKVYSLNLVYDDKDGEPIVNTTYVDPTSVIPLDGSIVDVVGSEKLAQEETLQTVAKEGTLQTLAKETTLQTLAKETTLQTVAKEGTLQTLAKETTLQTLAKDETVNKLLPCISFIQDSTGWTKKYAEDIKLLINNRNIPRPPRSENLVFNERFFSGTLFQFKDDIYISLCSDCISIVKGNKVKLLGSMIFYNNGRFKSLIGVTFDVSDVLKIST